MPREVFAEELEAFLERLDAVAAVRIVANDAGEIDRIYATTESGRDDASIRRAITSALMSRYNLHVDGWRVHVAHLEPERRTEPIPPCELVRLEEVLSETMTRIVVELRYDRDGVTKTLKGAAQALPGQAHRTRTAALAALDALRPLAERAGVRLTLEGLTVMPFATGRVVLAALSLAAASGSRLRVGAEVVTGSEAEAVVSAILDAVRKPVRTFGAGRERRRERLRRHYEGLVESSASVAPAPTRPASPEAAVEEPEPRAVWPEADADAAGATETVSHPSPLAAADPPPVAGAVTDPPPVTGADLVQRLAEIRPEPEGGASVIMREDVRSEAMAASRPVPRASIEDVFYRRLVATGAPVHIRCRDGYEIAGAVVKDFGTYSLLVESNGTQELVFKHGIIAIRPYGPLPAETPTPTV